VAYSTSVASTSSRSDPPTTMAGLFRLSVLGIFLLLLISGIAGIGAGENVTAENATVGNLTESPQHGYNTSVIQAGLSLDPDTNYRTNANFSGDVAAARVDATDVTYGHPVSTYEHWNQEEHAEFTAGGEDTSRYPQQATRYDGRIIHDAHITRFTHTPSTVAYYDNQTVRYSAPNGTVRGVVDYRVTEPADDERPQVEVDRYDTYKERSLIGHSIESVCLIREEKRGQITADDEPCSSIWTIGTGSPGPRPEIEYEDTPRRSATNYTLVAVIEADIEIRVRQFRPSDDEYTESWPVVDTYTITDRVVATDQWETIPYELQRTAFSQTDNSGTRYENDRAGVYVEPPDQPWAGIVVDDTYISSEWRFYSHRDTGWDTTITTTNSGDTATAEYDTVPIQQHAVPGPHGVSIQQPPEGSDIAVADVQRGGERTIPAAASHENLSVGIAGNQSQSLPRNYSRVSSVTIQGENIDFNNVTVKGPVNGTQKRATTAALRFEPTRKDSNLTARVVDTNATHVAVEIKLVDEDGSPIPLGNTNKGVIRLPTNETIQTNRTGYARVVIENYTSGTITYEPETWHGKTSAYKPSQAQYVAYPALRSQEVVFEWIAGLLIGSLPILLPWYYIRKYENMGNWVP